MIKNYLLLFVAVKSPAVLGHSNCIEVNFSNFECDIGKKTVLCVQFSMDIIICEEFSLRDHEDVYKQKDRVRDVIIMAEDFTTRHNSGKASP